MSQPTIIFDLSKGVVTTVGTAPGDAKLQELLASQSKTTTTAAQPNK